MDLDIRRENQSDLAVFSHKDGELDQERRQEKTP